MSYIVPAKRTLLPPTIEDASTEEADEPKMTTTPEEPKMEDEATQAEKPKIEEATEAEAAFTTPEKPKKEAAAEEQQEPRHKKQKKMLHAFHAIQFKYASDVAKHCNAIKDALLGLQKIDNDMANDATAAGYHSHADYVASLFFEDIHNDAEKFAGAATYHQASSMIHKVFRNATDVLITEAAQNGDLFTPESKKAAAAGTHRHRRQLEGGPH